ncbi:hypothetical protein BUALT_Bualt02G0104000 [Buddleja alternifolia]|uniref:Uncharacterized protein n=1 Tax=Buddleja alternifolia TaxID=168488 RepID=A0AAV6YA73_9LAMI|nr:hypothetical protein BUALT_Bualt02G0104000 [Buddleja alternifolia]
MIGGCIDGVVGALGGTSNTTSSSQSTRSIPHHNEPELEQSRGSTTRTSATSHESAAPATSGLSKRKGRGAAHFPAKWGFEPLEVSVNELNQYIGKDHALLSTALGNLARMENLLPLNYEKWFDMPRSRLDDVWNEVQVLKL